MAFRHKRGIVRPKHFVLPVPNALLYLEGPNASDEDPKGEDIAPMGKTLTSFEENLRSNSVVNMAT